MPLPHTLHGWLEGEYVKWVDEHTQTEAWSLIESALAHWEKVHEADDDVGEAGEYLRLARDVLSQAKSGT